MKADNAITPENMRIISAIYLNCKTVLQDDWICKPNADQDVELGKVVMRT